MKDEQIEQEYQVGDYVDVNSLSWNAKIIIAKNPISSVDQFLKLKDPKYNSLATENINAKSNKIKPFRTMSQQRGTYNSSYINNKWKKIDVEGLQKRQKELEEFIQDLQIKSEKQIIQYLRGRHYYFGEELINSQLQEKSHYQAMMKYFDTHRQLLVKYIKTVCFDESTNDIYYNHMSALCSCFPQLMQFTSYAVGIASEFDTIRKEYPHWHNQMAFQQKISKWIQQQFYPAIIDSQIQQFPPNFIFNIFSMLGSLFSKVVISNLHATPQVYQLLYDNLKRSLFCNSYTPKELYNFDNNCQIYFKQFANDSDDNFSEFSQTEPLEEMIDQSKHEMSPPINSGKKREKINGKAEFARIKRTEFKIHMIEVYYSKNDKERFLREFATLAADINSRHFQQSFEIQDKWPRQLKFFINTIKDKDLIQKAIQFNPPPNDSNQQRTIIMKLYAYCPYLILSELVQKEKLILLKHFIQPQFKSIITLNLMNDMVDKIISQSDRAKNPKEYLDFFNYLEKCLKTTYPNDNIRYLRQKIIEVIFKMASYLNKQQHRSIVEAILDFSDPLREELWVTYTEQKIIPKANDSYSYFNEISIQKYFQKSQIGIECFQKICRFMIDDDIREQKYQKRKASVIQSLNYQYRCNRANYLQYLQIFLDYFCNPYHDKEEKDWVSLLPFPNDQKSPSFLTLPITQEFCKKYLVKLTPLYYQTDIVVFCKLMLKLNILNGRVVINEENQSVVKVIQLPEYFHELLMNLYGSLETPRFDLVKKQMQKYFHGAAHNDEVYNPMLMVLLQVINGHEARRPQVNLAFKRLKTRQHLIAKQTIGIGLKSEQTLICRNRKLAHKNVDIVLSNQKDDYIEPLLIQQQCRINSELLINRIELIKNIRYKLALRLNRQPNDIIFLLQSKPLELDKYNLSFQQVYFEQFYSEQKTKQNPFIQFQFSLQPTPIRAQIINRFPSFYNILPNSISLIKGIDIMEEDWNTNFSLQFLKILFKSTLQRGNFASEQLKDSSRLDLILDFYIWKLQNRQKYNYNPLVKLLKKNQNDDTVLRNYKIVYLVNQSENIELDFVDCDQLMMCLLPDASIYKDKSDKISKLKSTKQYQVLQVMVSRLIENYCKNNVQFMATCTYFNEFVLYQDYYPTYQKLWTKIYSNAPIQEKQAFFSSFKENIINFPDNMKEFYTIIDYEQLSKNTEFYQEKIGQITSILLSLNKDTLTLTEMRISQILITNICQLTDQEKIFHPILQSKEMVQFIKNNIYHCQEKTQRQLFNIMKIVVANRDNRLQLLEFFQRETKEKQWLVKPHLIKLMARSLQLEGRVGLRNPHSVCYANSFLQQLYHIDLFREQLFDTLFTQNHNQEEDLIYQLKKIFIHLHISRQSYINMDFFKAFKNMDGEQTNIEVQMDVDQFRNLLLDRIETAIPASNNFVKRLFNGKQKSIIKSQECEHQSKKQQQFSSLCVQVKGFNNLQDSLNNYFKPQILKNENAYYCDDCKKKVTAQKIIQIQQLPPYLTFVLKRFQYVSYSRSKINTYFEFPINQFQYFSGVKYTLKGVIVHMGISQAGHYVSFAKHKDVWYEFNDCRVEEVDERRLQQNCFGHNSRGGAWSIFQSKNAYVLIYESDKLPQKSTFDGIDRTFYGITDQYKKIVRNRALSSKQRVYFSQNFLQSLNYIAERFSDSNTLHLLFWTLMVIHLRIKNDYVKHDVLLKSFIILKKNRNEFKFLWYQEIDKVIEVFTSQMSAEYKSILIQILVQNCEQYNANVQKILQICLRKIYQQKIDHTGYYMFMHLIAKKFDEACNYLNSQRIVGRVFDILYMGIVGEKVRQNLKKSCDVQFEQGQTISKVFKDNTKSQFKYHKWALVTHILEKSNMNLHEIQKQNYLYQINNITLNVIFAQATEKPIVKYVSKIFTILIKDNIQLFNKLQNYIGEQLREKNDFRKYMKVWKEILFVNHDDQAGERNKTAVIFFIKILRKLYDEKRDFAFLYVWQWFLSITKTNSFFRTRIKQHSAIFEYLTAATPQTIGVYRNKIYDGGYRFQPTKQPLYGIIAPTTLSQAEALIRSKCDETDFYLCEDSQVHDSNDYDGDIVNVKIEDGSVLLKYDDLKLKFSEVTVQFSFGDILVLRDKSQRPKDISSCIFAKGEERLRLRTEQFPSILIQETVEKQLQTRKNS